MPDSEDHEFDPNGDTDFNMQAVQEHNEARQRRDLTQHLANALKLEDDEAEVLFENSSLDDLRESWNLVAQSMQEQETVSFSVMDEAIDLDDVDQPSIKALSEVFSEAAKEIRESRKAQTEIQQEQASEDLSESKGDEKIIDESFNSKSAEDKNLSLKDRLKRLINRKKQS